MAGKSTWASGVGGHSMATVSAIFIFFSLSSFTTLQKCSNNIVSLQHTRLIDFLTFGAARPEKSKSPRQKKKPVETR